MSKLTVIVDGECAVITVDAHETKVVMNGPTSWTAPELAMAGLPGQLPGHGCIKITPDDLVLIKSTTGKQIDPEGVNHPKHYNSHPCGLEVIEVTNYLYSFNLGCVFKYVVRADHKDGLQALKKALWYADEETRNREYCTAKELLKQNGFRWAKLRDNLDAFYRHEPDSLVQQVLHVLFGMYFDSGHKPEDLRDAVSALLRQRNDDAKKQDGK